MSPLEEEVKDVFKTLQFITRTGAIGDGHQTPRWCATTPMARHTWPVRVAAVPLHAATTIILITIIGQGGGGEGEGGYQRMLAFTCIQSSHYVFESWAAGVEAMAAATAAAAAAAATLATAATTAPPSPSALVCTPWRTRGERRHC